MNQQIYKNLISILALILIALLIYIGFTLYQSGYLDPIKSYFPTFNSQNPKLQQPKEDNSGIYITEVTSNGEGFVSQAFGESYDWIELYNAQDYDINLLGYYLSDNIEKIHKYPLPDLMLMSGEYLVVFASGKDTVMNDELHTNFKISAKGENLFLFNQDSQVQKITVPTIPDGFSYGIGKDGNVGYLNPCTPFEQNESVFGNIEDYYQRKLNPNGIYFNEYASDEQLFIFDEHGQYGDWIEIINTTDITVDLSNYSITDDIIQPRKWILNQASLDAEAVLLIFADGKDMQDSIYFHTNFKIGENDEYLYLFNPSGDLVDMIGIVMTDQYVSYGRNHVSFEKWEYFDVPTPGGINIISGSAQKKKINMQNYLVINEVKTTNSNNPKDYYDFFDWIELYNNSDQPIDLSGFGLSDSKRNLYKWTFPNGNIINEHDFLLVMADSKEKADRYGDLNTGFSIESGLEDIYLTSNKGYIIDRVEGYYTIWGHTLTNSVTDGPLYYTNSTPGQTNDTHMYEGYSPAVCFNMNSGNYNQEISLQLSTYKSNAPIYYTLDGTTPTKNAIKYTQPISLQKDSIVKAISIAPGMITNKPMINNYIFNKDHEVAVALVTVDEKYLYDRDVGIIKNVSKELQAPCSIQIFEPDNAGCISFDAEIKLFGNTCKWAPQKSFAVEITSCEDSEGKDRIEYDLFPDDDKSLTVFRSFVFRAGGSEEWNRTKLTDASLTGLARLALDVDAQAYRPCAFYLNGEYYGLINIREKLNRDYIKSKYDFERQDISIVEPIPGQAYHAIHGSVLAFEELVAFINKNDMQNSQNYAYVCENLDIDNYIDTVLTHIILGNKDSGNIKFWKADIGECKWRTFLFDLDRAAYYATSNHLESRTSVYGHGSGNSFDTSLIRGLLENNDFEYQFCKRAIELIDTIYSPEFSIAYYEQLADKIDQEMKQNLDIWWEHAYNRVTSNTYYSDPPKTKSDALKFVYYEQDRHKKFLINRKDYFIPQLKSYFDLGDGDIENFRQEIKLENSPATRIYNEFMNTQSIQMAIDLSNNINTLTFTQ